MDKKTKVEYDEVLARMIWRNGYVFRDPITSHFMQFDYGLGSHARSCKMASHSVPIEDSWFDFKGTFYEGDHSESGMTMTATCECGEIENRKIAYATRVSEAIREMFEMMVEYLDAREEG